MKYEAVVEPLGRGAGVEVPTLVLESFDAGKRPKVVITINGHSWRSGIVPLGGRYYVGIGARSRDACGIVTGDSVDVDLVLDTEPRTVDLPEDLASALERDPHAREAYHRLPYGKQRGLVITIERAKAADTRQRRIAEAIASLLDSST